MIIIQSLEIIASNYDLVMNNFVEKNAAEQ